MSLNKRKNSRLIVKINRKPSTVIKNHVLNNNNNNSSDVFHNAIYANFNGIDDADLINIPLSVLEINEKNEQLAQQQQHHQRSTFYVVNNEKPKYHDPEPGTTNDITIGSLVEVMNDINDDPFYGVVRWMGARADSNFIQVGVELEDELLHLPLNLTDGTWNGERYFKCADGRALFVPLEQCHKDSRFQDGPAGVELAQSIPENVSRLLKWMFNRLLTFKIKFRSSRRAIQFRVRSRRSACRQKRMWRRFVASSAVYRVTIIPAIWT